MSVNQPLLRDRILAIWPNFTYHWHTPKVCHKCWHRMERKRLSMAEYQCKRCGDERMHGEYVSYRIQL